MERKRLWVHVHRGHRKEKARGGIDLRISAIKVKITIIYIRFISILESVVQEKQWTMSESKGFPDYSLQQSDFIVKEIFIWRLDYEFSQKCNVIVQKHNQNLRSMKQ